MRLLKYSRFALPPGIELKMTSSDSNPLQDINIYDLFPLNVIQDLIIGTIFVDNSHFLFYLTSPFCVNLLIQ